MVHDLDAEDAKVVKKVKMGSVAKDVRRFGMSLHQLTQRIAVRYGNRIRIAPLTKDDGDTIKFQLKHSVDNDAAHGGNDTTHSDNLTFTDDGAFVVVAGGSDGLLSFYSTTDGSREGTTAPLPPIARQILCDGFRTLPSAPARR